MVSIAGNSLVNLVTALNAELGAGQAFTASGDSVAANVVVASSMADTEAPTEKYGGFYLYCTNDGSPSRSGEQQRVKRDGFTGASGTFTTAANFSGNTNNGASWLLCGSMPVLDQDGLTGLRTCINRSLRKLWVRYHYPITSTGASVTEYDLGALWWAKRSRFLRLLDPDPGGTGHPVPSSIAWDVVQNADTWTLQLGSGFATSQVFYLVCEVPANYRLYLSSAWANQSSPTAGLVVRDDACLGSWNDVFQCALYECMKQLALQAGGTRKSYWDRRATEQRVVVSAIKAYQMDDDGTALGEGPTQGPEGSGLDPSKGLFSRGVF